MSAHAIPAYERGLALSGEGRHVEAIEQFEAALTVQPDDTRVLFALGSTAQALGLAGPAAEFYRRVLAREPARLEATVNLANLLRSQGQFQAALSVLAPALARHSDAPELWLTIGSTWREMGDAVQAEAHYREALARAPDFAPALSNLADVVADKGNTSEALTLYDHALAAAPDDPQVRLNRAVLHLLNGSLADGWTDYAARLAIPNKAPVASHGLPRWNGSAAGRLLVTAEQGVGDQIMFASMIPELAARGPLILECEPRLAPLFARSFPQVQVHGWDIEAAPGITRTRHGWLKAQGGADVAIELGSLAGLMRNSLDAFPSDDAYLKPDPIQLAYWSGVLEDAGDGPFIGLCWRSGNMAGHRALQYAPLEAWAQFARALPGTLVSVQYDAREDEIAALAHMSGRKILVPPALDQKNDLDRTAGLLASLDAVVTAPTAVSWLAAAVGTDTYKIVYDTAWTSFGQSHEPFAPSCSVMMPATRGDWASAFDQTLSRIGR
jgi:tetratricopeptide (TPR) repeat protein